VDHWRLPDGLTLARTTPEFTETTVPPALRHAHRVAEGVWGNVHVLEGLLHFRCGDYERVLSAGDSQAIPPSLDHEVEPIGSVRFVVEFWR
jgi:tellurite methyltransferase